MNPNCKKSIINRCVKRWFTCVGALLLLVTVASVWANPDVTALSHLSQNFMLYLPAVIASVILLPCFAYDSIKAINKIAGPITRLQSDMKKLRDGQELRELKFRGDDHWADLAEDFNTLAAEINRDRAAADLLDKKQRIFSISE